jgi:hypothetical protein
MAPMVALKDPAEQASQAELPGVSWKVPRVHAVQVVWLDEGCEVPAGQSSHAVAPVPELYVPAPQLSQLVWPFATWALPARQGRQLDWPRDGW